jgi:hypothetical protein
VSNGANWDILVAGPDLPSGATAHQAAIAKVDYTGNLVSGFGSSGITLMDFGTPLAPQDNIPGGLAVQATGKIIVGGTTCLTACTGVTPQSDFALARLLTDGTPDTTFGLSANGKRVFDVAYANIGYNVVLQPQTTGDPKIIIGGYSASSGGTPYMAGGRLVLDGIGTPDTFQSNFSGTSGPDGDQAWQLKVQPIDNKILAGGFHTQSTGPVFGIIRLCKDTDQSSCTGGSTASGGDREGTQPPAGPDAGAIVSAGQQAVALAANLPAPVRVVQESPAPQVPNAVAAPEADTTGAYQPAITMQNTVTDAMFAPSGLPSRSAPMPLEEDPLTWNVL